MAKQLSSHRAPRARNTPSPGERITADRATSATAGDAQGADPAAAAVTGVATGPIELIAELPLERIAPEPGFNPRQNMDEQELADLASSVALHGLLQPILVRPAPGRAGRYLLTGGHRRYAAAQRAGLKTVPAIVRRDGDALVAAVLDNSHRVDLNPLEEATAYARAIKEKGLTARGVAETFSVPLKRVTERLRILDTPEPVQQAVGAGTISVQQVAWYADLMAKSPPLATAIAVADVERDGKLDRDGVRAAIRSTEGIIDAAEIVAGGPAFELQTDEVRSAVETLAKLDGVYHGPDYEWRHGAGREFPQVRRRGDEPPTIVPTDALLEQGENVGAVVRIPTGDGWRPLAVIVDQAWLQGELDRALVSAYESLLEHRRRSRAGDASRQDDSELAPQEQAERARRRQERERQTREREQARELNARLGPALLTHLGAVELTLDAAKALCLLLLKPVEQYASTHDDVAAIAGAGLRYVLPDWQISETSRGKERPALICDRAELSKRFWAWWNAASTPQEVLGRTVIAFAAIHYADGRQALSKERLYGGGLPGHPDARRHLEALIDAKVPPALRKRRRARGARKPAGSSTAQRTRPGDGAQRRQA